MWMLFKNSFQKALKQIMIAEQIIDEELPFDNGSNNGRGCVAAVITMNTMVISL